MATSCEVDEIIMRSTLYAIKYGTLFFVQPGHVIKLDIAILHLLFNLYYFDIHGQFLL